MDPKDKVLPIVGITSISDNRSLEMAAHALAVVQRNADWFVLLRDYVSREQVKALVVAARAVNRWYREGAVEENLSSVDFDCLQEALAQLGLEVKG